MAATSVFLVKESGGTYALNGPPKFEKWNDFKEDLEEARFTTVSGNGYLVAVGNNSRVNIFSTTDGSLKCTVPNRVLGASFSPQGNYLITWDNPSQHQDNFKITWISGGKDVKVVHSLKLSKQPDCQFSHDETVFARQSNNTVFFSQVPDFQNTAKKTPDNLKVAKFSVSPGNGPLHVLCFIPATTKGQPSFARMYRYPNFENIISSKSFFQADRVEMKWSPKGNAVLLITSTDIDKTGQSYYGKTMLHYLDTKGETAVIQTEADSAVIHAAEWSPNSNEFAIISGKMPHTRAALMNSKCQIILDMDVSARNAIHFNPQGNLLLLGGFGNLSQGKIEIWEVKKLKKMIATCSASETTQLTWLNDGVHFITATTAPRMQVGNKFRVWDFTGKQVHEWEATKHLFGILPFLRDPPPPFPEDKLDNLNKQLGNKPVARVEEKKAAAYVPPSKRGIIGGGAVMPAKAAPKAAAPPPSSALPDKEKKIRAVKKKIEAIEKLKDLQKEGKTLEKNQLEKLSKEASLIDELEALELS
ncbi:Eukaryotic translation initiation factor 2A [Orchesella cincta]|uniref:Eukaryotic translation initiation factor 2A n=1 Tax=Orchesella cincta TaxID=48709 RepID=A0A1D2NJP5_ORCCI|nr:Eukaryotic translation initiation factor 2A [Orchesella cincta]